MIYGTVIAGTLRLDDRLEAFTEALAYLDPETAREIRNAHPAPYIWLDEDWNIARALDAFTPPDCPAIIREEADYLVNEVLVDALDACAPPGHYFGPLEGDGSDWGFFPPPGEEG